MNLRAFLLSWPFLLSWLFAAAIGASVPSFAQDSPAKPAEGSAPAPSADSGSGASSPGRARPEGNQESAGPSDAPGPAQAPAIKHDGGKNDLDAVGNRKVGGFDVYPIETDIRIGKAYAAQLDRNLKMVEDPAVKEYVNRVGQNLARNSDARIPFTIKVVEDDEINAMALPGGYLYVNSGLILAADNEAEMAGVMAHEIAHAALRHGTRTLTRVRMAQLLSIPVGVVVPLPVNVSGLVLPPAFLKFSRDFEAEADYFGIEYMYKAGYDPNELVNFFEKIHALEKRKPGAVARVFSTHPLTPDRIKKAQKEIATILPARDHYVETTSEFSDIKGRLAVLRNRLRMVDAGENKPALRRVSADSDAPGAGKKSTVSQDTTSQDTASQNDDRPVLNRRNQ